MMRARRLEVVDEYADDSRVAVFSSAGVVVVLSELASTAWSVLDEDWTSAEAVSEKLVVTFGTPPFADGDALLVTEEALRTLAEHGLVEVDEN